HSYTQHLHSLSSHLLLFFHLPPSTYFYTLSLHDALPICVFPIRRCAQSTIFARVFLTSGSVGNSSCSSTLPARSLLEQEEFPTRSEEHTSELQSRENLVCRLLLEKKK